MRRHDVEVNMSDESLDDAEMQRMAAAVMEAVQDGASLKDLQGVPQDLMDGVYAFAYRFYQQGRLDDAENFFVSYASTIFIMPNTSLGWRRYAS